MIRPFNSPTAWYSDTFAQNLNQGPTDIAGFNILWLTELHVNIWKVNTWKLLKKDRFHRLFLMELHV